MFQNLKPEIKMFLLVALIAVVVSVAGILLLQNMVSVSSQPGLQPSFSVGKEVTVEGKVIENVRDCEVDADCYLRLDVEGKELIVPYGYGRNTQGKYCTEGSVQYAFSIEKNDEVEVFGKVVSETELSPCDSSAYYINTLVRDPVVSSWQTYRNDEFGFEMKYPGGWSTMGSVDGLGRKALWRFQTPKGQIEFSVNKEHYTGSLDEYFSAEQKILSDVKEGNYILAEVKERTVGRQRALEIPGRIGDNFESVLIFVKNDSFVYQISFTVKRGIDSSGWAKVDKEEVGILKGILSTFKFTDQAQVAPTEVSRCSVTYIPGYEVAYGIPNPMEFQVDLNGDHQNEFVWVYEQKFLGQEVARSYVPSLPIIVKIFSGKPDCLQEEFSYTGMALLEGVSLRENDIYQYQAEVLENFWGDGRDVVKVVGKQTPDGSEYTIQPHFFTYEQGKYMRIDGPVLDPFLSDYEFNHQEPYGKKIIVAREIPSSRDVGDHFYILEVYDWNGKEYIKRELGRTKYNYIAPSIYTILRDEPEFREVVGVEMISSDNTKNWNTYRNEEFGFEFRYPSNSEVYDRNRVPQASFMGVCNPEITITCVEMPDEYPNDNLGGGVFAVVQGDYFVGNSCASADFDGVDTIVNGVTFKRYDIGDGAFSHFMDGNLYTISKNGEKTCLGIQLVVEGVSSYPEDVKEFTRQNYYEVFDRLNQFLSTFRFVE